MCKFNGKYCITNLVSYGIHIIMGDTNEYFLKVGIIITITSLTTADKKLA